MDNISNLFSNTRFTEPPEISIIKDFVLKTYDIAVKVLVKDNQVVIIVNSAALAGSLRPKLFELQKLCNTKKKFLIRIGD